MRSPSPEDHNCDTKIQTQISYKYLMCYLDCGSTCNRTVHHMATTVPAGVVDSNSNATACWTGCSGCS